MFKSIGTKMVRDFVRDFWYEKPQEPGTGNRVVYRTSPTYRVLQYLFSRDSRAKPQEPGTGNRVVYRTSPTYRVLQYLFSRDSRNLECRVLFANFKRRV